MDAPQLTGKWIAGLLYVILSVGLEYYPPFAGWWETVADGYKRLVVALAGLVAVAALVGLHYAGAFGLDIGPFGWEVVREAFNAWVAFVGGNWAIWSLVKETGHVPRKAYPEYM